MTARVTATALTVSREAIRRLLGCPAEGGGPRVEGLIDDAETELLPLLECRWWHRYLEGPELRASSFLRVVDAVVLCAVTIGPRPERWIERLQKRGAISAALVMDAWASAAVEATADLAEAEIVGEIRARGLTCSRRFSPGYGGWSVSEQSWLLGALGEEGTGLRLTPAGMLRPRKSTTFAVTVGEHPLELRCTGDCDACEVPHCRFRPGGTPPDRRRQSWWTATGPASGC